MQTDKWPADKVERRPILSLVPYARNARTHSDEQVAQVAASIREWGWTSPILVDEAGGIIAGHCRVMAARKLGIADVPVMVAAGWTEAQKRAYVLADNQLAITGSGWDRDLLKTELGDLNLGGFDLGLTGFSDLELGALLADKTAGLTDPDEAPEAPQEPVSALGDVWRLGRHRLICGDSSDASVINIVLGGRDADVVIYDPPYDVKDAWTWLANASRALVFFDYRRGREAVTALSGYQHIYEFIWDGVTSWYTPNRPLARHKSCFYASNDGVWQFDKSIYRDGKNRESKTVTNTRGSSDYKPLPECHVHLSTVFQAPNTMVDGGHAHAKPSTWVRALMLGTGGWRFLDQFVGSGTSFIAAGDDLEVFGVEIDPIMCDIAIARWESYSGHAAVRECI